MSHILQIPRSDTSDGSTVVVNVNFREVDPLDVFLIATEGEHPYTGTVCQNRLGSLKSKTYRGDNEQWKNLLVDILVGKGGHCSQGTGLLEVSAAIADQVATIYIRENVDGIMQKIGSILLQKDEDHEIELFEWTNIAAKDCIDTKNEISTLREKLDFQASTITHLTEQLETMLSNKISHETMLLKRFQNLVNSKKLKIRDQQRHMQGNEVRLESEIDTSEATISASRARWQAYNSTRPGKEDGSPASSESTDNRIGSKTPDLSESSNHDADDIQVQQGSPLHQVASTRGKGEVLEEEGSMHKIAEGGVTPYQIQSQYLDRRAEDPSQRETLIGSGRHTQQSHSPSSNISYEDVTDDDEL